MSKSFAAWLAWAALGIGASAHALPVTYNLIPFTGDLGSTLTGSVTVDKQPPSGPIVPGQVVSWSFTSIGPVNFSINSSMANSSFVCRTNPNCFVFLSFTDVIVSDAVSIYEFLAPNSFVVFSPRSVQWSDPFALDKVNANLALNHLIGSVAPIVPPDPRPNPMPEPSSPALFGIGLAALWIFRRQRARLF